MKKIMTCFWAIAVCSIANAAGLKQAEVTAVVKDVSITNPTEAAKPAKVKDVVTGKTAVNTGAKSRAELMFNDKTLTRLGANTSFSFEEGTRNMDLKKGTMLLQVPKNKGGATIHMGGVTASIVGTTVMLEHLPGRRVKVIVLEGVLKLYLNGRSGEFIEIHPGQMIVMNPNSKTLPKPVDIDLKKLVKTSVLVNGCGKNLDMTLINDAITQQQEDIKNSKLVIVDREMDANELMNTIDRASNANRNTRPDPPANQTGGTGSITHGP